MADKYDWKLNINQDATYDCMSLGSLILRLDSGHVPTRQARHFDAHVSGAEYNLAANLQRYGMKTAVLTGMGKYCIGDLIKSHVREVGVEILGKEFEHTPWSGHHATVYSYSPHGALPNVIEYNRSDEAGVMIKPGDLDYGEIFKGGVKWVHSGGLYAALAEHTPELIIEFFEAAKAQGAIVSFDLNYREGLWKDNGGQVECIKQLSEIVKHVDVLFGNESDAKNALGITTKVKGKNKFDIAPFTDVQEKLRNEYENLQVIVTSQREELNNSQHNWGAVASVRGEVVYVPSKEIAVLCRIGGGDGLAGGFVKGIFEGLNPQDALFAGWASGAQVAAVKGDITQSNWEEVWAVAEGYRDGKPPKVKR